MTEQTKPADKKPSVAELADSMPGELPYGLREAMAELQIDNQLPRVNEHIFVRDVLPVLYGDEGDRVDMKWWGGRFDSPFRGFLIVNNADEVLFEVPPLLDRNFELVPADGTRDTVSEAAATYRNRVYNNPGQARGEMLAALRRRIDLKTTGRPLEHLQQLDKIFQHYGRESIFAKAPQEEVRKVANLPTVETTVEQGAPAGQVFEDKDYSDEGLLD